MSDELPLFAEEVSANAQRITDLSTRTVGPVKVLLDPQHPRSTRTVSIQ
ncbi:Protein of unknown function [Propionibacterium freudenreichii]|nr:Putative uncharacterized protein [Propionibacterium freudenreichii subsp. freudenreichii]CEI23893.1 Protein of unknown function [Propionibacterium freudenreichii]CEI46635.1 Protein of unknown function [Propionibacterium freudenreichii]